MSTRIVLSPSLINVMVEDRSKSPLGSVTMLPDVRGITSTSVICNIRGVGNIGGSVFVGFDAGSDDTVGGSDA